MHRVAGVAQRGGEMANGLGEPERVVKDDDLGHVPEAIDRKVRTPLTTSSIGRLARRLASGASASPRATT